MKKKTDPFQIREAWLLCFGLGIVMLNYPFLHIFNKTTFFFGLPLLYLYFLVGWPISILVIFFFCRQLEKSEEDPDQDQQGPP